MGVDALIEIEMYVEENLPMCKNLAFLHVFVPFRRNGVTSQLKLSSYVVKWLQM